MAQSIVEFVLRTRRSMKYVPTPNTIVLVGSDAGSGTQRMLIRIETLGAIVCFTGSLLSRRIREI